MNIYIRINGFFFLQQIVVISTIRYMMSNAMPFAPLPGDWMEEEIINARIFPNKRN
jgi:hypothetical protein